MDTTQSLVFKEVFNKSLSLSVLFVALISKRILCPLVYNVGAFLASDEDLTAGSSGRQNGRRKEERPIPLFPVPISFIQAA